MRSLLAFGDGKSNPISRGSLSNFADILADKVLLDSREGSLVACRCAVAGFFVLIAFCIGGDGGLGVGIAGKSDDTDSGRCLGICGGGEYFRGENSSPAWPALGSVGCLRDLDLASVALVSWLPITREVGSEAG